MKNDMEFNEKIEKIEAAAISENMDEISPLVKEVDTDLSDSPESVSPENIEMSTCTCTGGCGSNYSYGGCTCTGSCGSNYHK